MGWRESCSVHHPSQICAVSRECPLLAMCDCPFKHFTNRVGVGLSYPNSYPNSFNQQKIRAPLPQWQLHTFSSVSGHYHHLGYPLTARVIGAQKMISQSVSSIFLCSPLPLGTLRTPGLSIPWCCRPTSSVCLVFLSSSSFHCTLQDGFARLDE